MTAQPRSIKETQAWARDLTALRITLEEMTAGMGGLLERFPVSVAAQRRRLLRLYELGQTTRAALDAERVIVSVSKPRTVAHGPFTHHECPVCGLEFPKVTQVWRRRCDDCKREAERIRLRKWRAAQRIA